MKKIVFLSIIMFFAQSLTAKSIREQIQDNPKLSAHTYLAYPDRNGIKYTPAPNGYTPFHMEHYGRHGSRWLTNENQYNQPIEALKKADKYGYLTLQGKDALKRLIKVQKAANNRYGELSSLGAKQHRGIAQRMTRNFPEIFSGDAQIEARSTVVIRCILSMENECQELKAFNPQMNLFHDASNADMYFMNYYDDIFNESHKKARAYYKQITSNNVNPHKFIDRLINNATFAQDSIDAEKTMNNIFDVASNMQSHDFDFDFYDLFTTDEIYSLWNNWNKFWYIGYGNSVEYGNKHPFIQKNLLSNIISSADMAIKSKNHGASLRFGHEICVLPLAVLMELNDSNKQVNSFDILADNWLAQDIFPMACNIQLIFYRNSTNDDILVKALLNEEEVTLPIKSNLAPYYNWKDLRAYYLNKISE